MSSHIDFNETKTNREIMSILLSDHTTNKNIMWCTPVSDIDKQLYKKYSLTEEETQYIEDIIKPMV